MARGRKFNWVQTCTECKHSFGTDGQSWNTSSERCLTYWSAHLSRFIRVNRPVRQSRCRLKCLQFCHSYKLPALPAVHCQQWNQRRACSPTGPVYSHRYEIPFTYRHHWSTKRGRLYLLSIYHLNPASYKARDLIFNDKYLWIVLRMLGLHEKLMYCIKIITTTIININILCIEGAEINFI